MISKEGPFGVGLGGWFVNYPIYRDPKAPWVDPNRYVREESAHNDWLEWIAETGVLGTLALLFMMGVFLRTWNREKWHRLGGWHAASFVGIVATAVQAVVSSNFHQPPTILLMALGFGVLGNPSTGDRFRIVRWGRIGRGLAVLFGLGVLLCLPDTGTRVYRAMLLLGQSQRAKGRADYPEQASCAFRGVRMAPGNSKILESAGAALASQGRPDEAETCFDQALRSDPHSFNLHFLLGKVFVEKDQPSQAEHEFREVVRLVPLHGDARYSLGRLLGTRGDHVEAREHLEKALGSQGAPELETRYYLGLSCFALKDYAATAANFSRALAILPEGKENASRRERIRTYLDRARAAMDKTNTGSRSIDR
jgi:tetratricopeptide (TPR) repeat protein